MPLQSTFLVRVKAKLNGTGLIIGERWVLTSRHLLEGADATVEGAFGERSATLKLEHGRDLCVLETTEVIPCTPPTRLFKLAQIDLASASSRYECESMGYPSGFANFGNDIWSAMMELDCHSMTTELMVAYVEASRRLTEPMDYQGLSGAPLFFGESSRGLILGTTFRVAKRAHALEAVATAGAATILKSNAAFPLWIDGTEPIGSRLVRLSLKPGVTTKQIAAFFDRQLNGEPAQVTEVRNATTVPPRAHRSARPTTVRKAFRGPNSWAAVKKRGIR